MTAAAAPECDNCGRPLTDPQSIARRLGAHCWRKEHPRTVRTPGRGDDRPQPGDGQIAIPYQPTLTDGAAA